MDKLSDEPRKSTVLEFEKVSGEPIEMSLQRIDISQSVVRRSRRDRRIGSNSRHKWSLGGLEETRSSKQAAITHSVESSWADASKSREDRAEH